MSNKFITTTVTGIPDFRAGLLSIPKAMRQGVLQRILKDAAQPVLSAARMAAPVSKNFKERGWSGGTLRSALTVRTSKLAKKAGNVGVFVNVKPLPGPKFKTTRAKVLGFKFKQRTLLKAGQAGRHNPKDPFYWRFQNFGWTTRSGRKIPGRRFLEAGAGRLNESLNIIIDELGSEIRKWDKPGGAGQ